MRQRTTRFGSFELDLALFEIRCNGEPRVVSKDELRRTLWKGKPVVDASITVAVTQARRALRDERRVLIRTHAGRGYSFHMPDAKR